MVARVDSKPAAGPAYVPCVIAGRGHAGGTHLSCAACVARAVRSVAPKETRVPAAKRHPCTLGHAHDSHGEATACPRVYAAAAHAGLTTFRPGRPGIPCFRVAPDDAGRPVFVSIDWVLVDAAGKIAALLDWKGAASHRSWQGRGGAFPRGKRIIESETGVPVVELRTVEEIETALGARKVGAS